MPLGTILGLLAGAPAWGQVPLTWARVESLRNQVQVYSRGQSRRANIADVLRIGDALRTSAYARAELRFNDGSLARVGERAVFRFSPNTRNFRLSNGTVLLLIPPGRGRTTIQTPNAATGIHGSALFVRFIPETSTTIVGALTTSEVGPMVAFNHDGSHQQPLRGGEMAVITADRPVERYTFDLRTFYETSGLALDMGLHQPATPPADEGLEAVKQEILEAIQEQGQFDEGPLLENPPFLSAQPGRRSEPRAASFSQIPPLAQSPAARFLAVPTVAAPAPAGLESRQVADGILDNGLGAGSTIESVSSAETMGVGRDWVISPSDSPILRQPAAPSADRSNGNSPQVTPPRGRPEPGSNPGRRPAVPPGRNNNGSGRGGSDKNPGRRPVVPPGQIIAPGLNRETD